jgi:DNA-binding SARP family transcriptional activator/alpha-beta hydrolase superfamily lysophospholipase
VPVEIRLLGAFTVVVDGVPVPDASWRRRDPAALVKVLALAPGRRMHREQVMEALWPDLDPGLAAARLHKAAHFARRAIGRSDALVLAAEHVALLPDAEVEVDAVRFEEAARSALADADEASVAAALGHCAGELLPTDRYEEWAFLPRERLQLRYRELLRVACRWTDLVALDPTDEEAHLGVMRELLARGDHAGVRHQYATLTRVLEEELGLGPSEEARALVAQAHAPAGTAAQPAEARAPRAANLATQAIHFCTTSDGVRLAYALSGSGPPLVKASNWLTHLDYDWVSPVWRHWWLALSRHHRLVRYDERGCGLSAWDVEELSLEAYVRDLEAVVDTLGLERFPLLGISQGGPIAVTYAARHPERVSALVLFGTGMRGRRRKATSERDHRELDALAELMRVSWGSDEPTFQQVYNARFLPEGPIERWRAFDELQKQSATPENAVRLWQSFQDSDVSGLAPCITAPTLVLHARGERLRPIEDGEGLAAAIPGARFVPLDSVNHILQEDEPAFARFVEEVDEFLREHATPA